MIWYSSVLLLYILSNIFSLFSGKERRGQKVPTDDNTNSTTELEKHVCAEFLKYFVKHACMKMFRIYIAFDMLSLILSVLHCNRTGECMQMNVRENRRGNQERTIQRLSTQDTGRRQTKLKGKHNTTQNINKIDEQHGPHQTWGKTRWSRRVCNVCFLIRILVSQKYLHTRAITCIENHYEKKPNGIRHPQYYSHMQDMFDTTIRKQTQIT